MTYKEDIDCEIKTFGGSNMCFGNEMASDHLKEKYIKGMTPRIENEGTRREIDNLETIFKLENSIDNEIADSTKFGKGFSFYK